MTPSPNPELRALSDMIERDINIYLAAGGKIDRCDEARPLNTVTEYNGRAHSATRSARGGKAGRA
ncbi:MAG: hypothetical protein AB7S42_12485 [Lysobacteraceae bacterium]